MPIVVIFVAVIILFSAINDKLSDLSALVKDDWQPSSGTSFGIWLLALIVIGVIGYYKPLKAFSNGFLVLVFVAIIISNKGFFSQFSSAFNFKFQASPGTGNSNATGSSSNAGATGWQSLISGAQSIFGNPFSSPSSSNANTFLGPIQNAAQQIGFQ